MTLGEKNKIVRGLVRNLDSHSPGEEAHAERVAVYSVAMGERLGLDDEELLSLRYSALLHDVGKVRVPSDLLSFVGHLSDDDMQTLRMHATLAFAVLESIPFLEASLPAIKHHHERWDGEGYPDGLRREAIPLGARILAIAEVFDTMTMGPAWARKLTEQQALRSLLAESGTSFDPEVTEAFLEVQPLIQPIGLPLDEA